MLVSNIIIKLIINLNSWYYYSIYYCVSRKFVRRTVCWIWKCI